MTNIFTVCLLTISLFCCTSLSTARQVPKECAKGPKYWCETLKNAAACGAVGHCTTTVWEMEVTDVKSNPVSDKIVQRFSQLKDVKTMINEDYLSSSVRSSCRDAGAAAALCLDGTEHLGAYLMHVLQSNTSPQTMCKIIQMCNNPQLDELADKKSVEPLKEKPLLGAMKCTWGPSYWCSNFSTGRECSATHHCVKRVWSKTDYPKDDDSICTICKDMVGQARDQLESNETQEELKQVFEGSCALIPIKIVSKECMHLADDFVPELVETLASEMDPNAVCSVAGLCNSARIDRLLEDYDATLKLREGCVGCERSVGVLRKRFDQTSYEDFLLGLLRVCQEMGSLSDSCSMLTFKYYENIVAAVQKDFTPRSVCHLSGQCAHKYHSHELYSFPDDQRDLKATDDVPCEFCEQVIKHLRDTMVANTTELEFKKVLTGLCKQSGSFKAECLSLVDQYFDLAYQFLVSELNATSVCAFMGLCGDRAEVSVAPLLPRELQVKTVALPQTLIGADEANSYKPSKHKSVAVPGALPQLPVERMFVSVPPEKSEGLCTFCQYFLHFLQVELSDETNEEVIKKAVETACDVLPTALDEQCRNFVSSFGETVIAMLVHQMDPSTVCPALGLCDKTQEIRRLAIHSDKSNCPLCLFAVEQLEMVLKSNKTEESIRRALSGLCGHLSSKMKTQCEGFVNEYSDRLVEMLAADLNAQEICVFLKLCQDDSKHTDPLGVTRQVDKYHERPHLRADRNNRRRPMLPGYMLEPGAGDIETNEIPDNTVNGRPVVPAGSAGSQGPVCVICEFVLKEIDDSIKDKHNEDEIKKVVHGICKRMPKSVRTQCDQFVEKYSDLVISLLAQELDPDEVCRELKLCTDADLKAVKEEVLECAVCESMVVVLKKVLTNKKVDDTLIHIAEKTCGMLPGKYYKRCVSMMDVYGAGLIRLVEDFGVRGVCARAGLCALRTGALALEAAP